MKKKRTVADVVKQLTKKKTVKAWAVVGNSYRHGELMQEGGKGQHAIYETKVEAKGCLNQYNAIRAVLQIVPVTITYQLSKAKSGAKPRKV